MTSNELASVTARTVVEERGYELPEQDDSQLAHISWFLERYTGSGWVLDCCSIEKNRESVNSGNALKATLSHESGSLVQIIPLDPSRHNKKIPVFDHNRVRVRDAYQDNNYYCTVGGRLEIDMSEPSNIQTLADSANHRRPWETTQLLHHSQESVHKDDERVTEGNSKKEYRIETLAETLIATIKAAKEITEREPNQASLNEF